MAPQGVRVTGLEEPLLAGHRYRVGCETFGSRPAPVLKWSIKRPDRLDEILAKQVRLSAGLLLLGARQACTVWRVQRSVTYCCTVKNTSRVKVLV